MRKQIIALMTVFVFACLYCMQAAAAYKTDNAEMLYKFGVSNEARHDGYITTDEFVTQAFRLAGIDYPGDDVISAAYEMGILPADRKSVV